MAEEVIDPELAGGTQEPATDTPTTDTPATDTPAADTPATDTPATDTPATDTPATDTPATDTPATDTPAADDSSGENGADNSSSGENGASTSGGTEYFNYEGIKSCFDELDAEFAAFAKTLETLNNTVQEKINVGPDSGVLGGYGTSIINLWNSNASTFGDFYKNFESWSATVISLANANGGFEGLTADMFLNHQSTGGTLDGVHDLRVTTAIGQGALRVDGKDIYDENNTITIGDFTYVRSIDEFGNTVIKKYDKDGNLVEIKLVTADGKNPELTKDPDTGLYIYTFKDENGKEVKYYYDDKGNVVQIEYTDENGVRHIITHTDENDNYNKDITEDYIWDEEKGEWVLDTSKQQEEAQAYIDSLKDPTTGEIDINNITQADLDKLSPEARQLVIDALADKIMEGYTNPVDAINAFGYENFEKLPKDLQEAIRARGDGSGGQQQGPEQTEGNPWDGGEVINENNSFGGKSYKAEDGTIYYLDGEGKLVSYNKGGTYYDADGQKIDDYQQWLEDRNNGGGQGEQTGGNPWDGGTVQAETNNYGGQTIQGADGATYYLDADGKLVASSKDGKYYAPDGTEIGNEEAYNNWLRDNGRPYSGNDEHGDYTATYENGTEIRTYEHSDGSKTTREIRYDNDGKPQEIIDRDANGKETARIEYDRSGSRTETYQYDGYQVKKYYDSQGNYTGSEHIENGNNYSFSDENNDHYGVDDGNGGGDTSQPPVQDPTQYGLDSEVDNWTQDDYAAWYALPEDQRQAALPPGVESITVSGASASDYTVTFTNTGSVDGYENVKSFTYSGNSSGSSVKYTFGVNAEGRVALSVNSNGMEISTYSGRSDGMTCSKTNGDGIVTKTFDGRADGMIGQIDHGTGYTENSYSNGTSDTSIWGQKFSTKDTGYEAVLNTQGKCFYAYDDKSYRDALANMSPGDTVVIRCRSVQYDPGADGYNRAWWKPESGGCVVLSYNTDKTATISGYDSWNCGGPGTVYTTSNSTDWSVWCSEGSIGDCEW